MLVPLLLLVSWAVDNDGVQPDDFWQIRVERKLSEVDLPASLFGDGWKSSPGLKVDDFEKLEKLRKTERESAEQLKKQLAELGIRSAADYTVTHSKIPLNTVTVRVFLFESSDQCRDWWTKKYQGKDWEKHYKLVSTEGQSPVRFVAADSLQGNKRVMAFGNVWITAHQLGDGDEHVKALNHIVDQLRRK